MARQNVSTGGPWEGKIGYSRAVRVGQSVQVSGTTAMTGAGLVGKDDPYAQTIQALKTIEAALVQAGARAQDIRDAARLGVTAEAPVIHPVAR